LWSLLIAIGAGFIGAGLNCEGGEGCSDGFPSWLRPWAWGGYYVYPEATIVGLVALIPASAFVAFVVVGRQMLAAFALVLSLALLSYPFFAGLTAEGRRIFWFGPLLGFAALRVMYGSRRRAARSATLC
jgi:hypothetical protein